MLMDDAGDCWRILPFLDSLACGRFENAGSSSVGRLPECSAPMALHRGPENLLAAIANERAVDDTSSSALCHIDTYGPAKQEVSCPLH